MPPEFFNIDQFMTATVAFLRIGAIMFMIPFFGETTIPLKVKTLLAIAISLTIVPMLPTDWVDAKKSDGSSNWYDDLQGVICRSSNWIYCKACF